MQTEIIFLVEESPEGRFEARALGQHSNAAWEMVREGT